MVEPAKNRQITASGQAAGATRRRTISASDIISSSNGRSGATATAICSACAPVMNSAAQQDEAGNRQIDEPRPVNIEAGWPVHLVLAKVEPALPVEQGTDLAHAHIVVGIGKDEAGDVVPARVDQPGRVEQPGQDDEQAPAAVDEFSKLVDQAGPRPCTVPGLAL